VIFASVREIFEALGFTVGWDSDTETVSLTNAVTSINFAVGSAVFTVDNIQHTMEYPARIINGSAFLPIETVLETAGYSVQSFTGLP
jgi:hypothetical protein